VSKVKPLKEEVAVELGADIFSEGLVLGITVCLILFGHECKVRRDAVRETSQNKRLADLESTLTTLAIDIEEQNKLLNKVDPPVLDIIAKTSAQQVSSASVPSGLDSPVLNISEKTSP